jgi:ELWxxDGT repeat protein
VYFAASDEPDACCRRQVWKSDGTVAGTVPVSADRFVNQTFSFASIGTRLYFAAMPDGDGEGVELWRLDTSPAGGPWSITDLDPHGSSYPSGFMKRGTNLIFAADDGVHGRELFELPMS